MPLLDMAPMCGILWVEQAIRGVRGNTFEVPQGQGADGGIVFEIGQRWLYAGLVHRRAEPAFIGATGQVTDQHDQGAIEMMRRSIIVGAMALVVLPQAALACTPNPNPDMRPWKDRVTGSSPMFIGTVVELRGADGQVWVDAPDCPTTGANKECEAFHHGSATVVFDVEVPIHGIADATFTIEQGFGSDCRVRFDLGQRWLFAGNLNESPSMYLNQSYDWQQAAEARKVAGSK